MLRLLSKDTHTDEAGARLQKGICLGDMTGLLEYWAVFLG
jgi:hypothetical protein